MNNSEQKYVCPFCGKKFENVGRLNKHINRCVYNPNLNIRYRKYLNKKMDVDEEYSYLHELIKMTLKCNKCNNEYTIECTLKNFDINNYSHYCSIECRNGHKHTENTKTKISESLKKRFPKKIKHKRCPICGDYDCDKEFCHDGQMMQKLKTLVKYFYFNENVIGTHGVFEEWNRLKNELYDMYIVQQKSSSDLSKYYNNYNPANINNILKHFGIKRRSLSEAVKLSFLHNRSGGIGTLQCFKQGVHTTWDNKTVYLRSSYEFDYAKILDSQKIEYEVETVRLEYYDSQRKTNRIAVPDFYIPSINTIVEIKSEYTLDVQEMKDKVKSYRENGFNFKLILEHKEVDLDTVTENLRETIQTRHKK